MSVKLGLWNRRLKKISGLKKDKIIRGWRKLHNKYLHNLYLLHIIRMMKPRRMGWGGHAACMWKKQNI
jgi:hypothetical protein